MAASALAARDLARILATIASIDHRHATLAERRQHILRRGTQRGLLARRKGGWRIGRGAGIQWTLLAPPARKTAIQHDDAIMAIIVECPPETRGELRGRM